MITPINKNIIIRKDRDNLVKLQTRDMYSKNILLNDNDEDEENLEIGTIIRLPKDKKTKLQLGTRILYDKYGSYKYKSKNEIDSETKKHETYISTFEEHILGIVHENKNGNEHIEMINDNVLIRTDKGDKQKNNIKQDWEYKNNNIATLRKDTQTEVGTIVDTGPTKNLEFKNNQRVIYRKYTNDEFQIQGIEHIVVRVEDIEAIIEGNDKDKTSKIIPFKDYIVLRTEKGDMESKNITQTWKKDTSKLYLQTKQARDNVGIVVNLGNHKNLNFKINDKVLCHNYIMTKITINDIEHGIIPKDCILALVQDEE